MTKSRILLISTILMSLLSVAAAENATLHGYLTDPDTGSPLDDITVEVFSASDHSQAVAVMRTDVKGHYNTTIPAGDTYDIYVRLGKANPSRQVYIPGGIQRVDFEIRLKDVSSSTNFAENSDFSIVAIVAVLILAVILIDQLTRRKKAQKKILPPLEEPAPIEKGAGEEDELSLLRKEKERIEYMVDLTKRKYHSRQMDEESFREIMRDYQKSLIELEAKIKELTAERLKSSSK